MKSSTMKGISYAVLIVGIIFSLVGGAVFQTYDIETQKHEYNIGLVIGEVLSVLLLFVIMFALSSILEQIELIRERQNNLYMELRKFIKQTKSRSLDDVKQSHNIHGDSTVYYDESKDLWVGQIRSSNLENDSTKLLEIYGKTRKEVKEKIEIFKSNPNNKTSLKDFNQQKSDEKDSNTDNELWGKPKGMSEAVYNTTLELLDSIDECINGDMELNDLHKKVREAYGKVKAHCDTSHTKTAISTDDYLIEIALEKIATTEDIIIDEIKGFKEDLLKHIGFED